MSARTSFCALVVTLAGAWLLLPPQPTSAQAPPGESTDQRLRRIEEKIDKLTAAVADLRGSAAKPATVAEREVQFVMNAVETLKRELEQGRTELWDLRCKWPALLYRTGPGGRNIYAERLARIEARRAELLIKMTELQAEIGLVDEVVRKEAASTAGNQADAARGLIVLLKRRGVDLTALTKKADQGDAAKTPSDAELLKSYRGSLLSEIDTYKVRLMALERQFEIEQKDAIDFASFEAKVQIKHEQYERTKALYDQMMKQAMEMKLSKARSE